MTSGSQILSWPPHPVTGIPLLTTAMAIVPAAGSLWFCNSGGNRGMFDQLLLGMTMLMLVTVLSSSGGTGGAVLAQVFFMRLPGTSRGRCEEEIMERSSRHHPPRPLSEMARSVNSTTTVGNHRGLMVPADIPASRRGPPGGDLPGTAGGILPCRLHLTPKGDCTVKGRAPRRREFSSAVVSATVSGIHVVTHAPVLLLPGGARAGFRSIGGDAVPPKLKPGTATQGSLTTS